jgi:hypothetical protein
MDGQTDKGIPVYPPLCEWGYNNQLSPKIIEHNKDKEIIMPIEN